MNLRSLYVAKQNDLLGAEQEKGEEKDRGAKKAVQVPDLDN